MVYTSIGNFGLGRIAERRHTAISIYNKAQLLQGVGCRREAILPNPKFTYTKS
ncbi:MAG: hypothetical protein PVJ62_02720 [Deltaproteobacteria bacterium]|jgi:hypothetical protein